MLDDLTEATAFRPYRRLEPTPQEREWAIDAAACPCTTCDFRAPCVQASGADHCPEWRAYIGLSPFVAVKAQPIKVKSVPATRQQENPAMAKPEMKVLPAARLPVALVLRLQELAKIEQRTDANMTAILVREALAARGVIENPRG